MVSEARVVVDGEAIASTTKTDTTRVIPLDGGLLKVLRTHKALQAREKMASGGSYQDGGYLVADELGRPYHPDTISDWFQKRAKAAGLPVIRLHDCRHTAATAMLAAGEQPRTVADILGHKSTRMVMEVYGHLLPGTTERAVERLSALFLGD
jgi:integrase